MIFSAISHWPDIDLQVEKRLAAADGGRELRALFPGPAIHHIAADLLTSCIRYSSYVTRISDLLYVLAFFTGVHG
jgi:hypothetical protein